MYHDHTIPVYIGDRPLWTIAGQALDYFPFFFLARFIGGFALTGYARVFSVLSFGYVIGLFVLLSQGSNGPYETGMCDVGHRALPSLGLLYM